MGFLCQFVSFCMRRLWKNSNYTAIKSSATIALYRSFAVHWAGISARRDASSGRSKLGRSKLGRNGENIGRSAPYRSEKNAEYLEEPPN